MRSRAAAQLLTGKGFNTVYNLKGGINAWQGLRAVGPVEMGMVTLRGDERPEEIIIFTYGMEEGSAGFYKRMAEKTDDSEVVDILTGLREVEEDHKQRLFDLYLTLGPTITDREAFESDIVSGVMESGFTTGEFLEQNKDSLKTVSDVLNLAMMLETQALDLYLRYTEKTKDEKCRAVLYEIAEEEKVHLSTLGSLLEKRA